MKKVYFSTPILILYCFGSNIGCGAQQHFNYRPVAASSHIRRLQNQLIPLLPFPTRLQDQQSQVPIQTYPEQQEEQQEEQLKKIERRLVKSMIWTQKLEHEGRWGQYGSKNKELKQQQETNRKSDSCETVLSVNQKGNLEDISQLAPMTENNTQEDKSEQFQKILYIKIPEACCSLSKLEAFHEQYRDLESGVIRYQSAIEAFQDLEQLEDYFAPNFDGTEETAALKKSLKCQRSEIFRLNQQRVTIHQADSEIKNFMRILHENQVELCQKLIKPVAK